jgi:hypothetical protein
MHDIGVRRQTMCIEAGPAAAAGEPATAAKLDLWHGGRPATAAAGRYSIEEIECVRGPTRLATLECQPHPKAHQEDGITNHRGCPISPRHAQDASPQEARRCCETANGPQTDRRQDKESRVSVLFQASPKTCDRQVALSSGAQLVNWH